MATEQPNVLVILADYIGWFDIGAYHRGMGLGRQTSIASQPRAPCSPTATGKQAAQPAARR